MSTQFTPGVATRIAHNCTVGTTGNNHPLSPSDTLGDYGVFSGEQISLIKTRIREDEDIGLPHFGRSIDPNAHKDLDTSWTIMKLSDVVFDHSFSSAMDLEFVAREVARPTTVPDVPRSNVLINFTRENPAVALAVSVTAGFVLGLFLSRSLR